MAAAAQAAARVAPRRPDPRDRVRHHVLREGRPEPQDDDVHGDGADARIRGDHRLGRAAGARRRTPRRSVADGPAARPHGPDRRVRLVVGGTRRILAGRGPHARLQRRLRGVDRAREAGSGTLAGAPRRARARLGRRLRIRAADEDLPGPLGPADAYARIEEPFGYWNSVGLTAAMGAICCIWLGARRDGHALLRALSYPALGLLLLTLMLAYSRGSLAALATGLVLWFVLVPLRLRGAALLIIAAFAAGAVGAWDFATHSLSAESVGLADAPPPAISSAFWSS